MATPDSPPLHTPDGRYIVVRGRLWRAANPFLVAEAREELVRALMAARRDVRRARADGDADALHVARARVHAAKVALGERGPVWWTDGAPDLGRCKIEKTEYADWYNRLRSSLAPASDPPIPLSGAR
jgi:hypothetical protein